jgi:hypothetical protein
MQRCALLKSVFELNSKDIRDMNRALREIEPGLLKEMRKDIRQIAKPIEKRMKSNIPSTPPMSGMGAVVKYKSGNYAINEGRLRWDGQGLNPSAGKMRKNYAPNSTSISQAIKPSGRSLTTPLVKVIMQSAAVSMADMAGRVNRGRPVSREYVVRLRNGELQKRRHRVTTQGNQFMRNLSGRASRYAWPALENQLSQVEREIDKVIEKYYRIANRGN